MNHHPLDRRSIRMNLVHTRCEQVHTPTLPPSAHAARATTADGQWTDTPTGGTTESRRLPEQDLVE